MTHRDVLISVLRHYLQLQMKSLIKDKEGEESEINRRYYTMECVNPQGAGRNLSFARYIALVLPPEEGGHPDSSLAWVAASLAWVIASLAWVVVSLA